MNKLLTVQELADQLAVSADWVYTHLEREPKLPVVRLGRHVRFRQADIDRWLESRAA
jgi:excisionase family DNA binding protein